MLPAVLAGCNAQRPDVPAEAARLTGIDNAIVFRENPEPINAQDTAAGLLTPDQAIRLALARDPRIQAAIARVRIAEADANQARLLPNPILSIDLRFPVQSGSNTAFEPTLTADLVSLLLKPAQISAADHRLRASVTNALVVVLDVMSEVQEAYAAARSADLEIENAKSRRARLQKLHDLAEKRLEAGEATRLDVLTVNAQLMQSTLEIADFELQRTDDRLTLAKLLGTPRAQVDWQLTPWAPPPAGALAPESEWVDTALANRPEIQSKALELRALGDELSAAGLPPLPGDMGVHGEHDPQWRVGPTITTPVPIFDFGQAARAKIRAERIAARHDLAEMQLEVIQNVRSTYAAYMHARRALVDAQTMLLPLQQQQLDQAQLAYQAGEIDFAILLIAQNDFELTQAKIVELQEKVTVALVKLQRAAGGAGVANRITAPASQPATLSTSTTAPTSRPATGPAQ